jgi:prepilin-type N-terminal cleavage/methylation domain-containing protein
MFALVNMVGRDIRFDLGGIMRATLKMQVSANPRCVDANLPAPAQTPARRPGFSIVELLMVLLVMGIVAAIATPSFYRSLRYHELESAARRVRFDLEQAGHAARVKSQTQSLTFSSATTYTLSSGVASLESPGQTYTVDLAGAPYELDGVTIDFGGATTISFDGYGNASVGGTIVLALGGQTRTVTLSSTNGQITITDP